MNKFLGLDCEYDGADIVLFGAPFDGTSSYRPGSRFGPSTIRNESEGIETYSPYLDRDLSEIRVCDAGDLELPFGNTDRALEIIRRKTRKILSDGKIPLMLGGEHLITLPAVEAALEKYPELRIIHFDAHTDLRDEYLGEKLSHATVMRRIWELVGDNKIYQFGIRSGERHEFEFARAHTYLTKFNLEGFENTARDLKGLPVYFTLDLDVLDPSCFSGTGTPEPGGISFAELLIATRSLGGLNIVGIDINELSPDYDQSGASTAAACKILRELLLSINTGGRYE